jgi:hypothetical protein
MPRPHSGSLGPLGGYDASLSNQNGPVIDDQWTDLAGIRTAIPANAAQ